MNFLYFSITLFSFFLNFFLCVGGDPNLYTTCGKYFSCGTKIPKVGFPFWGGTSGPKDCGYPELELTCDDNGETKIDIKGMKFNVLDIDPKAKILTIVREDFAKGICLAEFNNTVLDFGLFDYAPGYKNITVFYGCPLSDGYGPPQPQPGQFTCTNSNAFAAQGAQGLGTTGCSAAVVVPVKGSLASQIDQESSLEQAIGQGFEVQYKVDNQTFCAKCEESKGVCGFVDDNISCFCSDGSPGHPSCSTSDAAFTSRSGSTSDKKTLSKPKIAIIASFSSMGIGLIIILACYIKRKLPSTSQELEDRKQDIEAFLRNYGSPGPKRYTYKDLKRITNSFKNKLGEGGYGTVYKGILHNGQLVAVKILKKTGDTGEFINEVASIGMTNHVNVVTLLGFCYEGRKRALVYEFMPNGSLEKFVYPVINNNQPLDWHMRFQIATGIARGLEYLHRGCNTRILHFDIKPHNILLDENFCPKISDFGLAKSCPQKDSIISMSEARGTIGYIAPEVFLRSFGGVSYKSDVYSYGMLVLEMVGCRKRAEVDSEVSNEQYFPQWIYKQLERGEETNDEESLNREERQLQRKMILVSLWCVQTNPSNRPAMSKVVEMLEGTLDLLQIPPAISMSSSLRSQVNCSTSTTIST